MKRIITVLAVLLVAASCSVTRDRVTAVYFADYTAYPDMWISPNSCPLQHQALGELLIEIQPAITRSSRKAGDGMYSQSLSSLNYERISGSELLRMAVDEAQFRGANGISNYQVTTRRTESGTITEYDISGVLIRIE